MLNTVNDATIQELAQESIQDSTIQATPRLHGQSKPNRIVPRETIIRENKLDRDRRRREDQRSKEEGGHWGAVNSVRLHDVRRVLRDRYGDQLPDDDAGRDDLWVLLHIKSCATSIPRRQKAILVEINDWAPWLDEDEAEQLAGQIAAHPIYFTSVTLGRKLNVTSADRDRLRLRQIGAMDL